MCASEVAEEAWPGMPHQNKTESCPARAGGGAQEMTHKICSNKWDSTFTHLSAQQGL